MTPDFTNYHTRALFEYICSQRDMYFEIEEQVDIASTLNEFTMWLVELINGMFNGAIAKCFTSHKNDYFLIERKLVNVGELAYAFCQLAYEF